MQKEFHHGNRIIYSRSRCSTHAAGAIDCNTSKMKSYIYTEFGSKRSRFEVNANRIVTIENKAVYYEYIKTSNKDELVIYLGDFGVKVQSYFQVS